MVYVKLTFNQLFDAINGKKLFIKIILHVSFNIIERKTTVKNGNRKIEEFMTMPRGVIFI